MGDFPKELGDGQQVLIDTIWGGYLKAGRRQWPVFDYVEGTLEKFGLDARAVMASLPAVGHFNPPYGLVRPAMGHVPADQELPLTLAGLSFVSEASDLVGLFLRMLTMMAAVRRGAEFSVLQVTPVVLTDRMVADELKPAGTLLAELGLLATSEPPTSHWKQSKVPDGAQWALSVPRGVSVFQDVATVADYLARMEVFLEVPVTAPTPRYVSPFELNATLDYFNTTWRLYFGPGRPLVRIHSAERAAKLALPAGTQDEFDSRMSALGEIIKNFDVPSTPGVDGHPLKRMEAFLRNELPMADAARIGQALDVLRAVQDVRNAGQHSPAAVQAAASLPRLGLGWPITDWAEAWSKVTTASIGAFDALREEIATAKEA